MWFTETRPFPTILEKAARYQSRVFTTPRISMSICALLANSRILRLPTHCAALHRSRPSDTAVSFLLDFSLYYLLHRQ